MGRGIGLDELTERVWADSASSKWFILITRASDVERIAGKLAKRLAALGEFPIEHVDRPVDAENLADRCAHPGSLLLASGLDGFTSEAWSRLDQRRSRRFQMRGAPVVLLLSGRDLRQLEQHAPNIFSFAEGAIFEHDPHAGLLSERERVDRLEALRAWAQLTDNDVLKLAAEGRLPPQPEFAEWLVLLGQGDLIGPR
jgi:hypothetical protein